jgi:hypothetical protein
MKMMTERASVNP